MLAESRIDRYTQTHTQTDRRLDHNTPHPYRGGVKIPTTWCDRWRRYDVFISFVVKTTFSKKRGSFWVLRGIISNLSASIIWSTCRLVSTTTRLVKWSIGSAGWARWLEQTFRWCKKVFKNQLQFYSGKLLVWCHITHSRQKRHANLQVQITQKLQLIDLIERIEWSLLMCETVNLKNVFPRLFYTSIYNYFSRNVYCIMLWCFSYLKLFQRRMATKHR